MLMCEDEDGSRVTVVGDPDYTRVLIEAEPNIVASLEIPPGSICSAVRGGHRTSKR